MKIGGGIVIGKDDAAGASAVRKPPEDRRSRSSNPNPRPRHMCSYMDILHTARISLLHMISISSAIEDGRLDNIASLHDRIMASKGCLAVIMLSVTKDHSAHSGEPRNSRTSIRSQCTWRSL